MRNIVVETSKKRIRGEEREERAGQLLVYWYINETIGIVRWPYINTTETSVWFMSQRRAVGRRALACVRRLL